MTLAMSPGGPGRNARIGQRIGDLLRRHAASCLDSTRPDSDQVPEPLGHEDHLRVAHRGEPGLGQRVIYNEYVHAVNLPVDQDQLSGGRVESFS